MMLVHKHPILPMSPSLAHRRNPSAPPVVIVQPTRTPGLLSLSKPPRPSPPPHHQRQLHAQQRQNKAMAKPRPQHHLLTTILTPPTTADADKKLPVPAAVPTPSPQPRSRTNAKHPKEKTSNSQSQTSSSHNSLRGRPSRQPSPPILPQTRTKTSSLQAEGPTSRPTQSSNLFDPFLDDTLNKPQPTLTTKPSGKLAHRRQQHQTGNAAGSAPPSPTPGSTKAIPVPSSNPRTHTHNLSRSDPAVPSHMPADLRRRSSTVGLVKFDVFPICDDMTDAGDVSDHGSAPVTPTRPKAQNKFGPSPRTAPLTGAFPLFPSAPSSAPQQKIHQGGRRHRRSPSEGVFTMSSDEDSASSRFINPNVAALFQLARTPGAPGKKTPTHMQSPYKTPVPAAPKFARDSSPSAAMTKEKQFEKEAAERVAGYFASSSFQNSPNPEELPDPLFM
ncbi:hypothetical protein JOM56_000467 [Amanita muscaria]